MLNKFESYLYGLILTDGSIYTTTRNRGKITIELNSKDAELLQKIQERVPHSKLTPRTRDTNFKQHSQTIVFSNYQKSFRDKFIQAGIPLENKSVYGTCPQTEYIIPDFWRGVYDGNGSLGFTSKHEPYISLVTKSEKLQITLCQLLSTQFHIIKHIHPNKRDHVYNITLKNEDAVSFSAFLYENAEIYMLRKHQAYQQIQTWTRTCPKRTKITWSDDEIVFIQSHTIEECIANLHRSKSSIETKLWHLKKSNNH